MRSQRQTSRIPETVKVDVTILSVDEQAKLPSRVLHGRSRDLSTAGIRLIYETPLPVGARLNLQITTNRPRQIFEHAGTIRWSEETSQPGIYCAGVEFTHSDRPTMTRWRRYVLSKLWPAPHWRDDLSFATDIITTS